MAEAASVFASVVPSLRGWSGKLAAGLKKEKTQNVDVDVTPKVDQKALNKAETEVRAASARIAKARKAEEDAAGRLRVAEAALDDTRRKGNATSAQVVAAEERVSKSSRDSAVARDALVKSENALAAARAKVASIKGEADRKLTVQVDADTGAARAQLRAFHQWATTFIGKPIEVNVDVDTGAAVSKLLAVAVGMTALTAGAGLATYSVASLGAALVPAVGVLGLIPALAGAAGLGIAALKIGTSGFGDAVKLAFDPTKAEEFAAAIAKMPPPMRDTVLAVQSLNPQLTAMRTQVQSAMFAGMAADVKNLGGIYLPLLTGALVPIATGFATARGELSGWLQTSYGIDVVRTLLDNSSIAVTNLTGAFAPLVTAFLTIGAIGAPILANLTEGAGGVAGRFASWVGSAEGINTIREWIFGALQVLDDLWHVVVNVGSVLGSLFSAAQASGANFLGTLRMVTTDLANGLKTPEGAATLTAFFVNIRGMIEAARPGLVAIGETLMSVVGNVAPALPALGAAFSDVMKALQPFAEALGWLVGAILPVIAPLIGPIVGILAPLAIVITGVVYAIRGWLLVQAFLNTALWGMVAALLANPITWIVIGIMLLVGAVIYAYTHFEWFRDIVSGAWAIIQNVATQAWIGLQQIFSGIGIAVSAVGAFFVWLWQTVIVPAWTAISTAISWAWNTIIFPVLTAIGTALAYLGLAITVVLVTPFVLAWQAVVAIVTWAWQGIVQPIFDQINIGLTILGIAFTFFWNGIVVPVWNGIVAAITAAWNFIRDAIFNPIVAFIQGVLAAAWNFLWNGVIVPVWNGIMAAIGAAWNWIQGNVFNPIMAFIRGPLTETWNFLWHNVIEPVWNGIQTAIRVAWDFILGVFETGKAGVNAVGQAFQFVADWVGRAWATIREAAAAPIRFVVDIVYNNGIRPVWNGIASLFGMAQLPAVGFATGGIVPGYEPGVDRYPAMLSGGEGILVPEAVRGLGPAFVGWANRTFSGGRSSGGAGTPQGGGGYSRGGVAHFAEGGILGGIGALVGGTVDFLMKAFSDPAAAVRDLFSTIVGDNNNVPGGGQPWTEGPKKIVPKTIDAVIEKVKKWIAELAAMGGAGQWAGVASTALALAGAPQSWLPLMLAQIQSESGGNPNAINLWDSNARAGHPSQGLLQTIPSTFAAYAGPFRGLGITNPLANLYAAVKYVQARYGSPFGVWGAGHGYDQGGIAGGTGYMMKQTIQPERVLSPRQTAAFESLVPLISGLRSGAGATGYGASEFDRESGSGALIDTIENHYHGDSAGMDINDLTHALRVIKRGGRP